MEYTYICIDLKSYYASVECVARGLDPLKARLLVADKTRSDQTICLAVSIEIAETVVISPFYLESSNGLYVQF